MNMHLEYRNFCSSFLLQSNSVIIRACNNTRALPWDRECEGICTAESRKVCMKTLGDDQSKMKEESLEETAWAHRF